MIGKIEHINLKSFATYTSTPTTTSVCFLDLIRRSKNERSSSRSFEANLSRPPGFTTTSQPPVGWQRRFHPSASRVPKVNFESWEIRYRFFVCPSLFCFTFKVFFCVKIRLKLFGSILNAAINQNIKS